MEKKNATGLWRIGFHTCEMICHPTGAPLSSPWLGKLWVLMENQEAGEIEINGSLDTTERRDWRIGFKQIDGVVVEWQNSYTCLTLGDLCPEFINEK